MPNDKGIINLVKIECAAGRAAWQEAAALSVGGGGAGAGGAARRCSVLGDHPGARRDPRGKWHRNNRIRDASYGSSSDSDGELEGISGEPWGVARLLYAGLATLAVGLVVYFVGTGDKGFKTPALRLVGPSLIVAGLACCLLRIAFCIFAKPCCRRRTNYKENRRLSGCVEGEEMPLAGSGSRGVGPAQCSPARRLDASSCDVSSLSSGEEDERMRRYRTATLHPPILHQVTAHQNGGQNGHRLSPQDTLRHSPSPQSAARQTPSPHSTMHHSPQTQTAALSGATLPNTVQHSAIPSAVPLSATLPSAMASSANNANSGRRPPPRNVSFAGGSDGELVLSPAQLRS